MTGFNYLTENTRVKSKEYSSRPQIERKKHSKTEKTIERKGLRKEEDAPPVVDAIHMEDANGRNISGSSFFYKKFTHNNLKNPIPHFVHSFKGYVSIGVLIKL